MIPKYVYILFVIVAFFGLLPYIKQIISKKVRPNLVGWAMWSLAPLIAFAAQIKNGGGIETITTLSVGLVPLIVIVAALLAHSYVKQYTTTDAACFVFAVTGLILWRITKQPDLAIAFSIAADLFAGVPTMLHAYRKPLEENHWPFTKRATPW